LINAISKNMKDTENCFR